MKIVKKVQVLMLTALLILTGSHGVVLAARTPKVRGQNKNSWCWATSAKIVGEHNGGSWISTTPIVLDYTDGLHYYKGVPYFGVNSNGRYTADGPQRAIVKYIKGNDKNNGGSDSDKETALSYAASSSVTTGTFGNYGSPLSQSEINTIKNDLNSGRYVIGNMVAGGSGHSVAILQYDSTNDKYRIQDPWDLTDQYYSSYQIFTTAGFPIFNINTTGRIEWVQYCR